MEARGPNFPSPEHQDWVLALVAIDNEHQGGKLDLVAIGSESSRYRIFCFLLSVFMQTAMFCYQEMSVCMERIHLKLKLNLYKQLNLEYFLRHIPFQM